MALNDDIERHRPVVFEDINVGVDEKKSLLHEKIWYV